MTNKEESKKMSKRYGRQQKRKTKAKIESLQAKIGQLETIIAIKNSKASTAEYIIEIARKICPNSVCFEPQLVDGNIWSVVKRGVIDFNPAANGDYAVNAPVELCCVNLHQLELSLRESDFDKAIHYQAQLIDRHGYGRKAAYRISLERFNIVPIDHITHELAKYLKQPIY